MDLDVGDFDDRDFDDGEFSRWGDYDCAANQYIEPKWPIVLTPLAPPLRKQATQPTRKAPQPTPQAAFTTRSPVKTSARPQFLQPIAENTQTSSRTSSEELDDVVSVPEPQSLYRSQSTNALTTTRELSPSEYDPAKEPPLSLLVITPTQFNWSSTIPTLRQAPVASISDSEQPDNQPVPISDSTITKPVDMLEPRVLGSGGIASTTSSTVAIYTRLAECRLPQLKNAVSESDSDSCHQDIAEIRAQLAALVRASREKAWVHENGPRERSPLLRSPSTGVVVSRLPRHTEPTVKTRLKAVDTHPARHRRQSLAGTPTVDSQCFAMSAPRRQSLDGAFAAIEFKHDT